LFHVASFCRHVKPRTVEDVLRDVWKEALDYAKSDMWRNPDEVFVERADEIRELLGGDAE
jgi:nuclear transport factor 2 (NTF2) superfamily protein